MEYTHDLETLVRAAGLQESGSFHALYDQLVDKIYAYIRCRVSTEDDALDLTQDVFVDLYKALPQFVFETSPQFYSFLFLITKRKLAKFYAQKQRDPNHLAVSFEDDVHAASSEDRMQQDEISRALKNLEPLTREIILLHHWSRYTFGEIATLINMTESAVRVRHHRALDTLSAHIHSPS